MPLVIPGDQSRDCPDCPSIGGRHPNPFEMHWLVQTAPPGLIPGAPGWPPALIISPGARYRPETGHVNEHDVEWFRMIIASAHATYRLLGKRPPADLPDPGHSLFFNPGTPDA